ncbi:hypothetical protein PSTG_06906 [Puccinia striiformis f. sp. tritici PST-78]|uniref:Malonyl-CoA:ACP transacylase (MAT) domain-containing protein n=1 Tax=Puccinia striiformis f. sp. tritici PST-78 TaxID=1165861 RepID=A0A0L0VKL9_9BASI|nr:hypothetical protein PSTG_06906 [Puccinia striiformis f. sp. tritici PST-78]
MTTRPFVISHLRSGARVSFPVPSTESILSQAEISREEFLRWLDQQPSDSPLALLNTQSVGERSGEQEQEEEEQEEREGEEENDRAQKDLDQQRSLVLLAHYLEFLTINNKNGDGVVDLIQVTLKYFHQEVLKNQSIDVHSAAFDQTSSDEARRLVIRAYYLARHSIPDFPAPPVGKLWKSDEPQKKLVGVFGGQGVNETYWQELVNLYSLYPAILLPFLEAVDHHLQSLCSTDHAQASSLYKHHGIQILKWLNQPTTKPPMAYLASCAISLPLIGLVQIAHYITLGGAQGLTPNQISSQLQGGVTGHSQGVVVAALIAGELSATKDNWDEFNKSSLHAISVLFQIGYQGSKAFPQTSLPPKLTSITAENEGVPTPMLAVTGLSLDHLQKSIDSISDHLAEDHPDQQLPDAQVSLFNGSKAFVVTGHPKTLVGLVSALRKSKAEPGLDQSKIPFSKRLPVFSMRFLPIGVPYHSHHLEGCTSKMMSSIEEGGIGEEEQAWWESHKATLICPVFNTETGQDLRNEKNGFLKTLADQIFTSPIKWTSACAFPEDTTHIIDFGLGTLSGIGSLVARNIEGKGHRMVFQWAFQFPLWLQMRKEGLPMEGFVVAAGIPSTEKAKEIIAGLREAGIKHVSFKPGSVDGIRQVINIAAANPDFPVICQWTGGRAGGHHSCEDFHQPILATYASIRNHSNLILVVGSGFGSAEDVYPYLTGQWSRDRFDVEMMPFDGVLFASRMMVAKEAATSQSVKELIVKAAGVPDEKWEGTYDRETGGIITVTSELGEPIHKIATRGIKLWKEFDETVFALPREKRAAWLETHKDYVIKRLNADFQKPWFAEKDGQPAELGDMTYQETVNRLVKLMYVTHQKRWIDPTLRNLVGDWLRRIEERLSVVNGPAKISEIQSYSELDDPFPKLETFFARYPEASTQILASEDIAYFLALSQRPGQKPVPFIPVLDAQFGIWFKKDSLWQAEDIDAVVDQDPQRVAILQGPVAVMHSKSTEETAGEILGGIESGIVSRLLADEYEGDSSLVPSQDYMCREGVKIEGEEKERMLEGARIKYRVSPSSDRADQMVHVYDIDGHLPPPSQWIACLAGTPVGWLSALLRSISIVQGLDYVDNSIARVLAPKHHQRVMVLTDKIGTPINVKVFGGLPSLAHRDLPIPIKA